MILEKQLASNLLSKLKNEKNWFRVDQERDHYREGGPFNLKSKYFPGTDENTSKIAGVHKNTKK